MNFKKSSFTHSSLARISIWTLNHHDFLAAQIRIYVWSASATVLFLSIASLIPLHTALYILLFSGLGIMIVLWSLIAWRKTILLSITDKNLREEAHGAMLALIRSRPDSMKKTRYWLWRTNR